jgi:hypothetical protein
MSAILDYSSAGTSEFTTLSKGDPPYVFVFLWMYKEIEYMYITCYAVWVEDRFNGHDKQART